MYLVWPNTKQLNCAKWQCPKEGSNLKNICHNMYMTYNVFNSKENQTYIQVIWFEWLLPPLDLEPRSANHISTVLTAWPRLQHRKPRWHGLYSTRNQIFSTWGYNGHNWYNSFNWCNIWYKWYNHRTLPFISDLTAMLLI